MVYGNTCINWPTDQPTDRPTDRLCPSHSCDNDMLHVPTLPRHATFMCVVVNSAVRSGNSYKTENTDNGKVKSRDTHAMNCEAGTRERPATSSYLHFLVGVAILGYYVCQFSRRSLHTNPFSDFSTYTTRVHRILDKTYAHVMHTGMHRPHPLT